jgi:sialidase-1
MAPRALLVAAAAAASAAAAAAAPGAPPLPPLTDVFVGGAEGYACYRIPALVRLPTSGDLLAFAEGRRFNCDDHGWVDLVLKRSTDGGASWGALAVVHGESSPSANVTIGNPAPVALAPSAGGGEAVLLPFCRNNAAVGTLASADGGATWGPPADVPTPPGWTWVATGPPGSLQLAPSGRLLVPVDYYTRSAANYSSGALLSDDGGASWRVSSNGVAGGNEAQAAALPWVGPDAVLLSMRSASGRARLAAASADGGQSWGPPWATVVESQCEASTVALPSRAVLVMSSAYDPAGRTNMTLHVSGDAGRSWAPAVAVYPGPAAYSSLVVLSEGGSGGSAPPVVGLLFERDGYARLSFAAVGVPL